MKETKFIRDNGLKSAEKIIKGVPDKTATHYVSDTDTYFSEEFHTYFSHSLNDWEIADLHCVGDLEAVYELVLDLSELKRMVKSVEGINNLSNFEFKGSNNLAWAQLILNHAPIDSDAYSPITKNYFYSPNIRFDFDKREWVDMDRGVDLDLYQEFISIAELDQWIQDYELIYQPKCEHGFDVACLLCGFGTVDGERVYRNQGSSHEIK